MNIKLQDMTFVFQSMADGILIINQDYTIEFMNDAFIRDFGGCVGEKCHEVIHSSDIVCSHCKAPDVLKGETIHEEVYNSKAKKYFDEIKLPLKSADATTSCLSIYRDITDRKNREEELKSSVKDYKRLFENVGCGVFISSKDGKFLDANHALLNMLGYRTKEEFLEIDIAQDLYLRPEDRSKFQKLVEKEGRVIDHEVDFKRKDGTSISVLLTSQVRYDKDGNVIGYEGINVDQSLRKQMEKEIREGNDFLNNIIQSSPNAIMASDMKGNIMLWNKGAEEVLGYKSGDTIGKLHISKIYPEGMAKKIMQMIRSPEYGGVGILQSYPLVTLREGGEIVEGNLSAALVYDEKGKEIASVGIVVDLKERLDMERRLRETQEQLLQSEKLAAMGRLTSQIAHELNNPLYGIMNTLELLKTEVPPSNKRRKILDMALSETVRLSEMLHKMLSFSKPDQEVRKASDINTVLDEILILHEKQLRENDIQIFSDLSKDLGLVLASKNQLRQVFLNMISNAKDAMQMGGALKVKTYKEKENIVIQISDTGIGIQEKNLEKIFDTFFTTKDSIKGVGLGLSVCYGFIKDHGGDIEVKSKPGSGTTFTVILPEHKQTT